MPSTIILVSEEERLPLVMGDSADPDRTTVYYRRVPGKKRRAIISKHTVMGVTDWTAVGYDLVEYAVVGWDNLLDYAGRPVVYHRDLVAYLPEDTLTPVLGKLNENAPASFFGT